MGNILEFKQTATNNPGLMSRRWCTGKAPFKRTYHEESDECKFGNHSVTGGPIKHKYNLRAWNEKEKNRMCIPPGKVPRAYLESFLTFKLWLSCYAESPELLVFPADRMSRHNRNIKIKKTLEIKKWHKIEFTRRQMDKSNWKPNIVNHRMVGWTKFCYISSKVDGKEVDRTEIGCTGGTKERYKNVTIMSGNHNVPAPQYTHTGSFIPDMKIKNLKSTNLPDIWPKKD